MTAVLEVNDGHALAAQEADSLVVGYARDPCAERCPPGIVLPDVTEHLHEDILIHLLGILGDGDEPHHLREDLAAVAVDGLLLCLGTLPAQSLYQVCLGHAVFCLCLYIRRK